MLFIRDCDEAPIGAAVAIESLDDAVALDFATGVSHTDETVLNVVVESVIALRRQIEDSWASQVENLW